MDNPHKYSPQYIERHTRWLRNDLNEIFNWYARLKDDECPNLGENFVDAMIATKRREEIDLTDRPDIATFNPFSVQSGFRNLITYSTKSRENKGRLFLSQVHETTHAMQFANAAVYHADLFNKDTKVILCPHDFIRLRELAEADAYAKETWVMAVAQEQGLIDEKQCSARIMSADRFNEIRLYAPSLGDALAEAAREIMDTPIGAKTAEGIKQIPLKHIYHWAAVKNYVHGLNFRQHDLQNGNLVFAQMDSGDVVSAGKSFGPNIYDHNDEPVKTMCDMDAVTAQTLADLNQHYGLQEPHDFPTLGDALAGFGLDHETFLQHSRANTLGPALKNP